MNVPTFNEIWDEILSEKIIKKHKQYGNSLEEPVMVFNHYSVFPQDLIDVRVDDKLSRIRELDDDDPKYWSEIKEIIAYLMWKLYLKEHEDRGIAEEMERKLGEMGPIFSKEEEERAKRKEDFEKWKESEEEEIKHINCRCDSGQQGDEEQGPKDIRKICDDFLPFLGLRRLPSGQRRRLREEDFQ